MIKYALVTVLSVVAVVFFVYFVLSYNINQAVTDLSHIKIYYILYMLLFFSLFTITKIFPWTLALKVIKTKVPIFRSILMLYGFFALAFVPLGASQFVALKDLDRYRKNARFFSAGILMYIGITGGMCAIILAIVSSVMVSNVVAYVLIFMTVLLAVYYLAVSALGFEGPYLILEKAFKTRKLLRKSKIIKRIGRYVEGMRKSRALLSQKFMLLGVAYFIPSLIFESMLLLTIMAAFSVNISFFAAVLVLTVSVTVGTMSLMPVGLGTQDATMLTLLVLFGSPGAIALPGIIIFRFFNTFLVVVVGYAALFVLKSIESRPVRRPRNR